MKKFCSIFCLFLLFTGCTRQQTNTSSSTSQSSSISSSTSSSVPSESSDLDRAKELLSTMTLEEKVGQLFLVRCPEDMDVSSISEYHFGGYILFDRDVKDKTAEQLKQTITNYQKTSKIPMIISIDEEGGTVVRISKYPAYVSSPFLSPQQLYQIGGMQAIINDTIKKSQTLKSLGINVNLAPLCDVSTNATDYIYARAFGKDATQTAEYVTTVVSTMNEQKIGSVLKHFPGYGNNNDTHQGSVIDERSYETFVNSDFIPFQAGIQAGAKAIMVCHNIVTCMDAENPASLSSKVHDILRNDLNFTGVIMTDALDMNAISANLDTKEVAVAAILAGNDMLISTDFETQITAVLDAVREGQISQSRIDESVLRVLLWKISLGIIE